MLRAVQLTEEMKRHALELHDVLKQYDGGALRTWKLE